MSDQPLFIRSLAEWLDEGQLRLSKGGVCIEDDERETLVDYATRRMGGMEMETRRLLEAHGISRISDVVRYGEEFTKGTKRTKEGTIRREDWHTLVGREVKVQVKDRWKMGRITNYTAPVFVVDYEGGEGAKGAPFECIEALLPLQEVHAWQWITLPKEIECLQGILGEVPYIDKVTLGRDQCWATENEWFPMSGGWIWEVLGIRNKEVCVRTWRGMLGVKSSIVEVGEEVRLSSKSHGAATDVWLPICSMFYDRHTREVDRRRILLGPDVNVRGVTRKVIHMFRQPVAVTGDGLMEVPLFQQMWEYAEVTDGTTFTSDGSLQYEGNPIYNALIPQPYVLGRQLGSSPKASGALIARKDENHASMGSAAIFRVIDGETIRCRNSYDIELLLLTMGCMIRREYELRSYHREKTQLRSDSMAAITKGIGMDLAGIRKEGYKRHGILLRRIFHSRYGEDQLIEHVHGHPERRFRRGDKWQQLVGREAGIYIANKAAKYGLTEAERELVERDLERPMLTVRAKEVLTAIGAIDLWSVTDKEGVPILENPLEIIQRARFRGYLTKRAQLGGQTYWTEYIDTAPAVVFPNQRQITKQVQDTKLIFNWYMRAEHKGRGEPEVPCPLCGTQMQGNTEKHLYRDCNHVMVDNERRMLVEDLWAMVEKIPSAATHQRGVGTALLRLLLDDDERHLLWKGIILPTHVAILEAAQKHEQSQQPGTTSRQEARGTTVLIQAMFKRAGEMLRNIRKNTAATGYLMTPMHRQEVRLNQDQRVVRAQRGQKRLTEATGWKTNHKGIRTMKEVRHMYAAPKQQKDIRE